MPKYVYERPLILRPPDDFVHQNPHLRHTSQDLARKYASHEMVTEAELKAVGRQLWEAIDMDDGLDRAKEECGLAILPLIVESGIADVQLLPWETLHHPKYGFLGKSKQFTLTRRLRSKAAAAPAPAKGPLRILLFTSLPDDLNPETARLNVEEEQASVQEAASRWIAEGVAELSMPDDGRFESLREHLDSFQPHVLFISGHGQFHLHPSDGQAPYGEFLFEDENGMGKPIRDEVIANAFIGATVQAVVLSACESGKASSDALNQGLSRQLSHRGIPHVIGMRESIRDRAGIRFTHKLCTALAGRERLDEALQQARGAINFPLKADADLFGRKKSGPLDELSLGQWALPSLISADPARPLIDWDFSPKPPKINPINQSLQSISLPAHFVGRRTELRQLKGRLQRGELRRLLITGPGGQGKTALAGRLAQDLKRQGFEVFAWSASADQGWDDFLTEMELNLSPVLAEQYANQRRNSPDKTSQAKALLRFHLQQAKGQDGALF